MTQPPPSGPINWRAVCWRLMSAEFGPHLRPWEVTRLTLAEVVVYLEEAKAKPLRGRQVSPQERDAGIRRWRALSPREKLAEVRRHHED